MMIRDHSKLRAAAPVSTSFRQQFWLLGVSRRWLYPLGALLGLMMLTGHSWPYSLVAAALALVAGAIWPIIVWFGETPGRRSYHWSLPVPRAAHDLMRVAVGALYLIGICAGLGAAAAVGDGTLSYFTTAGPQAWAGFFLAPLVVYFVMTPLALWSDYAITRWWLGLSVSYAMIAVISEAQGFDLFIRGIERTLAEGRWNFTYTLTDAVAAMYRFDPTYPGHLPDPSNWFTAAALWLAFGVLWTLFTACFRPDDLMRSFRAKLRSTQPISP